MAEKLFIAEFTKKVFEYLEDRFECCEELKKQHENCEICNKLLCLWCVSRYGVDFRDYHGIDHDTMPYFEVYLCSKCHDTKIEDIYE